MDYKDVSLASHHNLAFEMEDMKRIVDAMTRDASRRLESIWCDSNACATYSITVHEGLWIEGLPEVIQDAVVKGGGGHNGIYFDSGAPIYTVNPFWPGDFDQCDK